MALSREAFKGFEDIVGPRNISEDPALLDSYRYQLMHTCVHTGPYFRVLTPRAEAVLLPGSVQEVQAIVRFCNKYKIKFKPGSTFWSAMGYPSDENSIQLDMRRMDRILEIDEKNMIAVIEPYVIGATLQAEAMKRGLNTHIIGAGASCSPLVAATSYMGPGPDTIFMGGGDENQVGVEWVLPNGDILRTGSLGSGLGWFCPVGPGPGVRGIVRGAYGAMGAMGVFTKCAIKLFPWPGPASLPVEGTVPAYKAALPENFRAYTLGFPTWKAFADACHKIWNAEIGYIAHRQYNMLGRDLKVAMIKILTDPAKTLSDLEEILKDPKIQQQTEEMKRDFELVLVGMTPRDIEWQEKALASILAETGGYKVSVMCEPDIQQWSLLYLIRMGHKNLNNVFTGVYDSSFLLPGPPDFGTAHIDEVTEFKNTWEEKGAMVSTGGDASMGGVAGVGGGGTCGWENFAHFDPHSKESVDGTYEFFQASTKFGIAKGWGPGMETMHIARRGPDGKATPREERERILSASSQPAVFRYQRKIKEILDPNNLGDVYYSTLDEPNR